MCIKTKTAWVVIHGRLEPETGNVLMKALEAAREALYQRTQVAHPDTGLINKNVPAGTFQDPAAEPPAFGQQPADALALLAETALHHGIDPGTPGERYQVVVHVDAPVLAESDALADPAASGQSLLEAGAHVSAETSRRLACDATRVVMRHDADGQVTEVGARTRAIPPALRRALQHRDRGCRFPARRCPAGSASVSTSAMRSTSCIRWQRPRARHSGTRTIAASDPHVAIARGCSVNPLRPRDVLRLALRPRGHAGMRGRPRVGWRPA